MGSTVGGLRTGSSLAVSFPLENLPFGEKAVFVHQVGGKLIWACRCRQLAQVSGIGLSPA